MSKPLRVLMVEDSYIDAALLVRELGNAGFDVSFERVATREDMSSALDRGPWDIILADHQMPRFNAIAALNLVKSKQLDIPLIIVSGILPEEEAFEAMRAGARDFVSKNRLARLAGAIDREVLQAKDREARRQAEERHRLVLDSTAEGIYGIDREGICTFTNAACLRLLGYSDSAELLGRNLHQVIHHTRPDVAPHNQLDCRIVTSIVKAEKVHADDEVFWRKDGTSFPAKYWCNPIYQGAAAIGSVVTFLDVTDKRRGEEEQRKLASLVEHSDDFIGMASLDGKAFYLNEAGRKLVGLDSLQDVTGLDISQFQPESEADKIREVAIPVALKMSRWQGESLLRHFKTGAPIDVLMNIFVVRRPQDGQPICIATVTRDITERKKSEQALRSSEEGLRAMVQSLDDIVFELDASGTYLNVWTHDEKLLACPAAELIGRRAPEVLGEEFFQPFLDAIQRVLKSGQREDLEYSLEVRGRKHWFQARISPVPAADGSFKTSCLVIREISERKQAEEEMRRAKEAAESANRAKSEFLANMSHEIRTPMNGILGMTELALETELTAEQRDYLGTVRESADALLTVINDILDFSKIDAGKLNLDPIHFSLRDSLAETAKLLAPAAHQKGLELVLAIHPDVPDLVRGDPTRLRQIIMNLVGNATKFTGRGEIVLRTELESSDESGMVLHFTVQDTGIGIPKEKQQVIFEAFAQADGSTTRRFGGTGLGLTISARLVELMAGRIWVESETGAGSKFHFTARFGKAERAAPAERGAAPLRVDLAGMRVLLVDDNATNRRYLGEVLRAWDMQVDLVTGAEDALKAMRQARTAGDPFRVVLTDAQMPGVDGFMLAERIREEPELDAPVVMMLSSGGQRGDAARCKQLGIAAYLTKPVRESELRESILRVLGKTGPAPVDPTLITRHSLRETRNGLQILLVEDNPVNTLLAARVLEKQGHKVFCVTSGSEALATLEKRRFDLAILDVQMAGMDGLELAQTIRAAETLAGNHLPLIAMTAHAMKGDRERCLAAGMDEYLAKPIRAQELLKTIDLVFQAHPSRDSAAPGGSGNPQ